MRAGKFVQAEKNVRGPEKCPLTIPMHVSDNVGAFHTQTHFPFKVCTESLEGGPRKNNQALVPHPTIPGLFSLASKSRRRRKRGGAGKTKKIKRDEDPLEGELRKIQKPVQVRVSVRVCVAIAKVSIAKS